MGLGLWECFQAPLPGHRKSWSRPGLGFQCSEPGLHTLHGKTCLLLFFSLVKFSSLFF